MTVTCGWKLLDWTAQISVFLWQQKVQYWTTMAQTLDVTVPSANRRVFHETVSFPDDTQFHGMSKSCYILVRESTGILTLANQWPVPFVNKSSEH